MRNELDPKDLPELLHLRGNVCIRAGAVSHEDAGVVDDTSRAGALHEPKGTVEKDPGLEAGEARGILDEELS